MCGICGYLRFDGDAGGGAEALRRMADRLVHRGPDDDGFFVDGAAGLAVRRLRVIDPEGGAQPRTGAGPSALVLNGEIYDFEAIRREIEPRSREPFRGRGDAEVALRAYQAIGLDFLERIDGMFALAVWDGESRSLLLARDRIGVKPLYYHVDADRIVFASEIGALLAYEPEREFKTDLVSLDQYLALEFVPAPRTLVEGVRKLSPGHYLRVGPDRVVEMRPYWQLEPAAPLSASESPALVLDALDRAVRAQLVSDVPLGVLLSGGLDSSAVAALAARARKGAPIKSFSIAFEDRSYDESDHARRVARAIGSDHRVTLVSAEAATLLPAVLARLDDLVADTSAFPTFLLSRAAREEVTVALSGDGGDELFGGYDTYAAERLARRYARLPRRLREAIARGVLGSTVPSPAKKGFKNRLRRFVAGERLPGDLHHYRWMVFLDAEERESLHGPALAEATRGRDALSPVRFAFSRSIASDPDARAMEVDLRLYLPDDILVKVDRMSMAHSLEVRVPILDHRVVELAQRVPVSLRSGGTRRKEVLRRAMRGLLPKETLWRGKEGFSAPLKHWLRGPLRALLRERLLDGGDPSLFRRDALERLLAEHDAGKEDHAHRLFPLLLFLLWRERFLRVASAAPGRI